MRWRQLGLASGGVKRLRYVKESLCNSMNKLIKCFSKLRDTLLATRIADIVCVK